MPPFCFLFFFLSICQPVTALIKLLFLHFFNGVGNIGHETLLWVFLLVPFFDLSLQDSIPMECIMGGRA